MLIRRPPDVPSSRITDQSLFGYNNYHEFGTDKDDPARNATRFRSRPWKVEVAGEVKRPAVPPRRPVGIGLCCYP